jgi:hypothetical protein
MLLRNTLVVLDQVLKMVPPSNVTLGTAHLVYHQPTLIVLRSALVPG